MSPNAEARWRTAKHASLLQGLSHNTPSQRTSALSQARRKCFADVSIRNPDVTLNGGTTERGKAKESPQQRLQEAEHNCVVHSSRRLSLKRSLDDDRWGPVHHHSRSILSYMAMK